MTKNDEDEFENARERELGRGYKYMTDEEVVRDLQRRFGDISDLTPPKPKGKK